jgi:lipopolysaccharide/colanic/teichoic acid biosynthesis glycosyltransferase
VDRVVFAPTSLDEAQVRAVLEAARATGVTLTVVPPCRSAFGPAAQLHRIAELPLLNYAASDPSRSTLFLKRVLDVAVSTVALVALLAPFVVIAIAIKLESRGPVFFSQLRAGQNGRPFRMRKFRTMVPNAEELLPDLVPFELLEEPMFKLRHDPRVTRVGRVLRRWSLDELPQLWNVLVAQMSLVGPRPEQLDLVERYALEHRFRLAVRPGITGPMQVYGRGQLTFGERLAVERDYIENLSIGRDLRILGATLTVVVTGRGAF